MTTINETINQLIAYGLKKHLIFEEDINYCANRMIHLLDINEFTYHEMDVVDDIQTILDKILDYAYEKQLIEQNSVVFHDLFDTEIMNCLMPRPSEVNQTFWSKYEKNQQLATDYYYHLSIDSNYIRNKRIKKNKIWKTQTQYGDIDITINLSKPEKDPVAIAMSKNKPKSTYPKCLLCKENEGYSGHLTHPARANHRIIKINLNKEDWYLQYSPYVYYNEHCIVFKSEHEPMKICQETFVRLLDFVSIFPHYFVGSNADLPIVGGSILSHDHFQGGHYKFAMTKATCDETFKVNGYSNVELGIVNWPMSVIRIKSPNKEDLIDLATNILNKWRQYCDESVGIYAYTNEEPHNTITPIARFRDNQYEIDLVLRNNRTDENHPLGIYHPHDEHHHIKRENIGLIEVMGLAVLPARLDEEMKLLKDYIIHNQNILDNEKIAKHADWVEMIKAKYDVINEENIDDIIKDEIGYTFASILTQCGVFKRDQKGQNAFKRFINSL